jgi:hypothetical protein
LGDGAICATANATERHRHPRRLTATAMADPRDCGPRRGSVIMMVIVIVIVIGD